MEFSLNWADLAVVLIILISCILEYRKGFIKSVFKTFSFVISIFVSWTIHPYVTAILKNSFVNTWVENGIRGHIFKETIDGELINKTQQAEVIDKLNIPDFFKDMLKSNDSIVNNNFLNFSEFKESIINFITNICIGVIAILVVIIVTMIILKIASNSLDLISKLPVLNEVNKSFGLLLGFILGVIEVWIGYMVITFIFITNSNAQSVFTEIEGSTVAKFLYENNLLNYIIAGIFGK